MFTGARKTLPVFTANKRGPYVFTGGDKMPCTLWSTTRVHGPCSDAGNTLAVRPVFTTREHRRCSRVVKRCLVHRWVRPCVHGCSDHTTRVHGPRYIPLSSARVYGPRSRVFGTHYPWSRYVNIAGVHGQSDGALYTLEYTGRIRHVYTGARNQCYFSCDFFQL